MFKKATKYFSIAVANSLLLLAILRLRTDRLENLFHPFAFLYGLMKIAVVTVISLIAIRLLVAWCRRKHIASVMLKMKMAALITLGISAWLYIDFGKELKQHILTDGNLRKTLAKKIKPPVQSALGSQGADLTITEYQYVARQNHFRKLPDEATEISYTYKYEDMLPDYELIIHYYVPLSVKTDSFNSQNGNFSRFQSYEISGNRKKVVYEEMLQ